MIQFSNGDPMFLLPAGPSPNQAAIDLGPGLFQIAISVDTSQGGPVGTPVDPYDGWVRLIWGETGVPVTTTSWSSLKALYR